MASISCMVDYIRLFHLVNRNGGGVCFVKYGYLFQTLYWPQRFFFVHCGSKITLAFRLLYKVAKNALNGNGQKEASASGGAAGYFGSFCATRFGVIVPGISV